MTYFHILTKIIDNADIQSYLELGVWDGKHFNEVNVPYKIGVGKRQNELQNIQCVYEGDVVSFSEELERQKDVTFDCVFVYAMTSFTKVFAAIMSIMPFLGKNGIVILHSTNPNDSICSANTSLEYKKAKPMNYNKIYYGAMWKVVLLLQRCCNVNIYTCDCVGYGITVVTFSDREVRNNDAELQEIEMLDYQYFDQHRNQILNFVSIDDLLERIRICKRISFIETLKKHVNIDNLLLQ